MTRRMPYLQFLSLSLSYLVTLPTTGGWVLFEEAWVDGFVTNSMGDKTWGFGQDLIGDKTWARSHRDRSHFSLSHTEHISTSLPQVSLSRQFTHIFRSQRNVRN
jgi:hypothetical protein